MGKRIRKSWYRGEHCNKHPDYRPIDVDKHILHGWLPDEPFITKDTYITAFGSCFAAEITAYLKKQGYRLGGPSKRRGSHSVISYGSGINTTFTLRQQFEWALEKKNFREKLWFGKDMELVEADEEKCNKTAEIFENTEVFILTLGLSEIWYNKNTGEVFWGAIPWGTYDKGEHAFRLSTVEENVDNLRTVCDIVAKHRPEAKIIFTLSPVTLRATFRPVSCITANTVSKAILRVAADTIVTERPDQTYYWPSYELVNEYFERPYEKDKRHVRPRVIRKIMEHFERHFCV